MHTARLEAVLALRTLCCVFRLPCLSPMAPAWLSSTLGNPAWCQAAVNCSYGLLCLTNDDAGYKVMYKDAKPDTAAMGMARFDGLELCKSGLILLASSEAPKSFRPTINGVVALNALADVGMTGAANERETQLHASLTSLSFVARFASEWQKRHAGLDEKQVRVGNASVGGMSGCIRR